MKWLSKAKKDRVVFINNKTNDVTYLPHTKTRSLNNPEEQVQLETYLSLIYEHGYPAENVRVCVPVKMGSATKEADIITYNDPEGYQPYMIVECKKKGVPESVFQGAIDQGFSYASATLAKYVWTTDGNKNAYHEVLSDRIGERKNNILPSPPPFQGSNNFGFKFKTALYRLLNAPFRLLGGFFKIPSIQNALIYIGILLTVMTLLTKVALNNMHSILKVSNTLWMEYGMDFSWIYYALAFTALMITISVGGALSFIPNMGKNALKKKQIILLSIFLFIPVWFAGSEFTKSWWNWEHYTNMEHVMWMFMGPQLAIAPIQLILFALILSISNKKPKPTPQRKRLAR
ncbi:type I restriction enzyme HsdR N-terminal domain-containing protein [Flammeovirga sp. EKP202]|uniref:type I restriction enzyme HsdR N-terminal domain-containing protein n=1 Tax=Flammeovirga sp. EKP202 TaxID=2770592 RepID=UPI00165FA484|nr:type I restriction enzyme HsdR N-terminal domain-containing protein [Flammeovirga sp. EKP202]MBD0401214.1 type I restriction enzyme HsdR N-terminal domain-containing protein [Flammeovirga sp. EKP202]